MTAKEVATLAKAVQVENLSAEEIKVQRKVLVGALAESEETTELAQRYVNARLDAKMRDEKLSEQGKTITQLQKSLDRLEEDNAELKAQIAQLQQHFESRATEWNTKQEEFKEQLKNLQEDHARQLEKLGKEHQTQIEQRDKWGVEMEERLAEKEQQYQEEKERANRFKAEALAKNRAINQAASVLNDVLSEQRISDLDKGNN